MTVLEHPVQRKSPEVQTGPPVFTALRPRQWAKNLLVFGAPLAAGTLTQFNVAMTSLATFGVFCAAASAVYLFNDVRDREVDAHHPRKRLRPIAAGRLRPDVAMGIAWLLAGLALIAAAHVSPGLLVICMIYLAMQTAYCVILRSVAIVDLLVVTAGFLLRALAGGAACGIVVTGWFVTVIGFASLFVVAGKRFSEVVADHEVKRDLARIYTPSYLRLVWTTAMTLTLTAYCLWVFDSVNVTWRAVSIVPFMAAILRYAQIVDGGQAEEPERTLLSDRMLLTCGAIWLISISAATVLTH